MKLRINGEWMQVAKDASLSSLLQQMAVPLQGVAVELNRQVLSPKDPWEKIVLKEGDTLEIVHAVGGGN